MINRFSILLLIFFLASGTAWAVTGGEVQVATNGQDSLERSNAYRTGLRWLLSNRPDDFGSIDRERVNTVLNSAENYVDAFEFIELPGQQALDSVPVTAKVREAGAATHLLSVQYSVEAISDALALDEAGENELIPEEPVVRIVNTALFWMLIRDGNKDLIVSDATTPGVASRLRELAGAFGWTIDFPELDVTDLAFIGPDEINNASQAEVTTGPVGLTLSPQLLRASQRYGRELVLTGTAAKDAAGAWQLSVRRDFLGPDDTLDQSFQAPLEATGPSLDRLLQQAVSWTAGVDSTAPAAFAETGSAVDNTLSDTGARIYVAGVAGATDYLRLMRLVADLAEVEDSRALEIGQNSLMIGVSPRSALSIVSSSLQSRGWLRLASREQLQDQAAASRAIRTTATPSALSVPSAESTLFADAAVELPADQQASRPSVPAPRLPTADLFLQVVK